jgi:hypothetical protein
MIARWRVARYARRRELGAYLKVDTGPSLAGCAIGCMLGLFLFLGLATSTKLSRIGWWLLVGAATWAAGLLFDLIVQPWTRRAWAYERGLVERAGRRLSHHTWDTVTVSDWYSPDDDGDPHKWDLEILHNPPIRITEADAGILLVRIPTLRHRPAEE